jgi:hypothetical protein
MAYKTAYPAITIAEAQADGMALEIEYMGQASSKVSLQAFYNTDEVKADEIQRMTITAFVRKRLHLLCLPPHFLDPLQPLLVKALRHTTESVPTKIQFFIIVVHSQPYTKATLILVLRTL